MRGTRLTGKLLGSNPRFRRSNRRFPAITIAVMAHHQRVRGKSHHDDEFWKLKAKLTDLGFKLDGPEPYTIVSISELNRLLDEFETLKRGSVAQWLRASGS